MPDLARSPCPEGHSQSMPGEGCSAGNVPLQPLEPRER